MNFKNIVTAISTLTAVTVIHYASSLGIPNNTWEVSQKAYNNAVKMRYVTNPKLTVIDFTLPSNKKRLWIVDMTTGKTILHTYVTHGVGSGDLYPKSFSNIEGTHKSSIGVYQTTGITYQGKNGYSLKINGLEKGFNDQAFNRSIVVHGATYIGGGKTGRSWGCPAVPMVESKESINLIKGGSIIVIYYPDSKWLLTSRFLK